MNRDSYLVEAVSGRWLRLPASFRKASCVVDLPNGIALNVSLSSGRIEIYSKAEDQIYRFSGEMALETVAQAAALYTTKVTYKSEPGMLPGQ
jgi:hypothetical protein